ncbi:MAG: hypothetical protein DRJ42_18190 [Deltaproteobacteria bacterium]|nr:MAG: hypothetical protein DRJ42_18190 [Deltaproteobacteria bacterium]
MGESPYIVLGRSRDCDLVLVDPSVSGRHARLSWKDGHILLEDLGSANGTFVRGVKVERARIRSGEDVRFGSDALRWSDSRLRGFLRAGAGGDTIVGMSIPGRRFICGACGTRGMLPSGFTKGVLKCKSCGASLFVGRSRPQGGMLAAGVVGVLAVAVAALWAVVWTGSGQGALGTAAERLGLGDARPRTSEEESVRVHTAPLVVRALDYEDALTRNTAVRIAAGEEGPFHVEQAARIWTHVRREWSYVNDPRGEEYFARSSETIANDFAGDCDDFAIVLSSMITSIGGDVRVVMMDGPAGGHAYAEVCIESDARDVAQRLSRYYRRRQNGQQRIDQIHFRSSERCGVWLNLDWNAGVPGGSYGAEEWAVAIYTDGHTERLTAAAGEGGATTPPNFTTPPR